MKNNFKPFDKVLVRDGNAYEWQPELFYKFDESKYHTLGNVEWSQCIPYEGNEHLMGTIKMPEIIDLNNNILFGIELKAGYVLEFDDFHVAGVVFPTEDGLAVSYLKGNWDYLKNVNISSITAIRSLVEKKSLKGGKLLRITNI